MARHPGASAVLAMAALAVVSAACGATASPTGVPATGGSTPTTNAPSAMATPEPPPALELLWEASGTTEITGWYPGTFQPAVDPQTGDIWVALSSEHLIWIFSKDGEYKGSFGGPGDGRGEFDFRRSACRDCPGAGALAFAPDGSLFVADVGNHRVQKFDPEHEFEKEWGGFGAGEGQFADALQIAANDGEVYVVDDARQDIQVFDPDGTFLRSSPIGGWPALDADGILYIAAEAAVYPVERDGTLGESIFLPDYQGALHIGLAIDTHGRLFFNYQDDQAPYGAVGLGEIDPSTGESRTWSTGGETLAIAGDVIYMANYNGAGWPTPVLRAYALPAP